MNTYRQIQYIYHYHNFIFCPNPPFFTPSFSNSVTSKFIKKAVNIPPPSNLPLHRNFVMFTIIYKHYIVKNITFYIHDQSHFVLILIVLAILNMLCLQEIEMFRFRVQSWKPSTISVRLDFLKCVQNSFSSQRKSVQKVCQDFLVSTQICTMTRKSRHTFCTDLHLEENENLNTLEKIWTDRNCWGFLSQDFIF